MKRIYLFNIVAWNYRKKIGFPVCKKENFAGLQAHRKRGKGARASPTPHHTLNEERSARFTAQPLSALVRAHIDCVSCQKIECTNYLWKYKTTWSHVSSLERFSLKLFVCTIHDLNCICSEFHINFRENQWHLLTQSVHIQWPKFLKEQKFSMAGEKRRDCETRGSQSTDAQNMSDVQVERKTAFTSFYQ